MPTNGKSFVSEVGSAIASLYVTIGVGVMAAFVFHVTGLGRTLIPEWAWNTCVLLFAAGLAIAIRNRDLRGLGIGMFMLLAAMLSLGMGQTLDSNVSSGSRIEQTYRDLAGAIGVLLPIVGGLVAVSFPFLSPKHVSRR